MRRMRPRQPLHAPFQAGLIALVVILIGIYLGASPRTSRSRSRTELKAVFENAPPIQKGQAVRIAGVDVGKVSTVEPVGGDSPAVVGDDEAQGRRAADPQGRPRSRCAPRIFFEGNLFFDIQPGHAQAGPTSTTATRSRSSQTSAPVQLDQVLGTLTDGHPRGPPEAADGLRRCAERRSRSPARTPTRIPDTKGKTGGQALNDSLKYSRRRAARRRRREPGHCSARSSHDLSKLIGGQQKIFAALVRARGVAQGPDHQLQHHDGGAGVRGDEPARDDPRAAAGARGGRARRSTT